MIRAHRPVVCTLTTKDAANQIDQWSELRNHATRIEPLPTGARMYFPAAMRPLIDDLVRREAACCSFVDFLTAGSGDEVMLEVTSPDPDALAVISLLTGLAHA
jgi:hypothetical protein